MKVYYIHWDFDSSADTKLYFMGKVDNHLFHHKENAEAFAKNRLEEITNKVKRGEELVDKLYNEGLTNEEYEELHKLHNHVYDDNPTAYLICDREIVFEDEE